MNTKEYSFWNLISEYKIEIPAIQRDYAQGRTSERRIANALIDDLFEALVSTETKKINLHFIYGKTNDGHHLIPLDGQQRLTTLFLLHWFLSIDFLSETDSAILSKFTYETRPSSEDFCSKLVKDKIIYQYDEKNIENQKISEQIENSKWFFLSWKNDPTISAMLNMLNIIQNKFKKPDKNLFERLISEDSPVRFHFLPLEKFKLDDKIYIKMNSRGKPLTEFENFKSNLSALFNNIEDKSKLDNEWLDIFWSFEKEKDKDNININEVDKRYLNFLKNATLNFYVEKNTIDKPSKDNFNIFDKYKEIYSDEEYLNELSKILDSLTLFDDSERYFFQFLKDEPDYWERLRFYAVMLFFVKKGNISDSNLEVYKKWIRVCVNLINNTRIEDTEEFYKGIRSLKALSNNIDNLYEYLSKPNNKIEGFLQKQCEEEKIKASLLFNDENIWKIKICEIEKHRYFDGQIGFILEFAKKNEKYDIESFVDYSAKLAILFDDFKDNKNCLFQKGLLTFGNYLVPINASLTFCIFTENLRDKTDNWRKVFDDKEKSLFLKNLLDKIHIDNIERDLNNIINEYSNIDWKYLFIKNEEIIKSCEKYKYRIRKWSRKIELCRSEARGSWRKHAELYSFALFKAKLEGKKFLPFQSVWYKNSSDYDPDAAIVIDRWFFNKYSFALDIKYNDYFIIHFYEKNRNQIPNEVQTLLNKLYFQQKITSLYESWEYDVYDVKENDFDKVEEIIVGQMEEMQRFSNI